MARCFVQLVVCLLASPAAVGAGRVEPPDAGVDDAAALVQNGAEVMHAFDESGAPISRARALMLTRRHETKVAEVLAKRAENIATKREKKEARIAKKAEDGKRGFMGSGVTKLFRRKSKVTTDVALLDGVQEQTKVDVNDRANATVRARFYAAPGGQDCPKGWSTIVDKDICREAANVLGGHDNTDWEHTWSNKPSGCFLHVANENVNFNSNGKGHLNDDERRFCENSTIFFDRVRAEFEAERLEEKAARKQERAEKAEIERLLAASKKQHNAQMAATPETVELQSVGKKKYKAQGRRASPERRAQMAAEREKRESEAKKEADVDAAMELVNAGDISADEFFTFEAAGR